MTDINNIYTSRTIAPGLIRLGDHPWSWVRLSDLTELFGLTPAAIWEHYCSDARMSALQADWSGRTWKFALPVSTHQHQIHEVWNMKTGERRQVNAVEVAKVLIPAGWSKARTKCADDLERAISDLIAEAAPQVSHGNWPVLNAIAKRWRGRVATAVQAIDTFSNLELSVAQIRSAPDGLKIVCKDDDEHSTRRVYFQDRRYGMPVVIVKVQLVLGKLKFIDVDLSEFDNEFRN